jgi:hypothetical protein
MDRRVPALAALLVAALLIATPLYLFPHAGQSAYHHSVERIDESEIPSEVDVRAYGNLSPAGQRAFDAALAAPDGTAVVHGEADRPPEFFYSDHADYGRGIYVIEKDDRYYRLETSAGGGFFAAGRFVVAALALLGGAVAVVGAVGWRDERRRAPAVAAVGGLAVLLAVAAANAGLGDVAALLIAVLAVPVGWGAVGATHDARGALGGVVAAGGLLVAATWATETGGPFTVIAGLAAVAAAATGLGVAVRAARQRLA